MRHVTTEVDRFPETPSREFSEGILRLPQSEESRRTLNDLVREGARRMFQSALDAEVDSLIERHAHRRDEQCRRLVVRNGYLPSREITTGAGQLEVEQPRVRDKPLSSEDRVSFSSSILPPYLRKSRAVEELIPWLYLKGVSTGDFSEALQSLLGADASGLSPNVVVRLKEKWGHEYDDWMKRDLSSKRYIYLWADGIYANVRLEDEANSRKCLLVLMGADEEGNKELICVLDGHRESKQSWMELLLDLKQRGLVLPSHGLAVGDGALGFWAAIREVLSEVREQRCWLHKTVNVLNKLPKSVRPKAKEDLHEIWQAETREAAHQAFDHFGEKYKLKYESAWECLNKDRDALLAFYDYPAEHWQHLRTTNPIESTFSTIRLRHRKTKGSGTRRASLTMMWRLAKSAEKALEKTQRTRANSSPPRRKEIRQRNPQRSRLIHTARTQELTIARHSPVSGRRTK